MRHAVILVHPVDLQPVIPGRAGKAAGRGAGAGGLDQRAAGIAGGGLDLIGPGQVQRFRLGAADIDQRPFQRVGILHLDRHRRLRQAAIAVRHLVGKAVLPDKGRVRRISEGSVRVPRQGAVADIAQDLRHVQRVAVQVVVIVQHARRVDHQRGVQIGDIAVIAGGRVDISGILDHVERVDPRRFAGILDAAQRDHVAIGQRHRDVLRLDRVVAASAGPAGDLHAVHQHGELRHAVILVHPVDLQPVVPGRAGEAAGRGAGAGGFDHRPAGITGQGFNLVGSGQIQRFCLGGAYCYVRHTFSQAD